MRVARAPRSDVGGALRGASAPVVLLEDPRNLCNLGASCAWRRGPTPPGVLTTGARTRGAGRAARLGRAPLRVAGSAEQQRESAPPAGRDRPRRRPLRPPRASARAISPSAPSATASAPNCAAPPTARRAADAPRGLQPQPRDLGRRGPLRLAARAARLTFVQRRPHRDQQGVGIERLLHQARLAARDPVLQNHVVGVARRETRQQRRGGRPVPCRTCRASPRGSSSRSMPPSCASQAATAAAPPTASITVYPARLRMRWVSRRTASSSSTTRIVSP